MGWGRGCSDAIPAEGDCSSLGLQPPPTRPSRPRVAGAQEGRADLCALSGASEVARETLNFAHLVPCPPPTPSASAHPSSTMITPTHGLAPGSRAGSRGFPPETERLLPLQSSQLPGILHRPVSPTEHLGSLPSSPRVRVRERHPHTSPEPGALSASHKHTHAAQTGRQPPAPTSRTMLTIQVVQLEAHGAFDKTQTPLQRRPPPPQPRGHTKATQKFKIRHHPGE